MKMNNIFIFYFLELTNSFFFNYKKIFKSSENRLFLSFFID